MATWSNPSVKARRKSCARRSCKENLENSKTAQLEGFLCSYDATNYLRDFCFGNNWNRSWDFFQIIIKDEDLNDYSFSIDFKVISFKFCLFIIYVSKIGGPFYISVQIICQSTFNKNLIWSVISCSICFILWIVCSFIDMFRTAKIAEIFANNFF